MYLYEEKEHGPKAAHNTCDFIYVRHIFQIHHYVKPNPNPNPFNVKQLSNCDKLAALYKVERDNRRSVYLVYTYM